MSIADVSDLDDLISFVEHSRCDYQITRQDCGSYVVLGQYSTFIARSVNDRKVVGFLIVQSALEVCDVIYIFVCADYRRMGIGSLMLNKMYSIMCESDVFLEVSQVNTSAIQFYLRHGFEEIGIRTKYYGDCDAILLKRPRSKY